MNTLLISLNLVTQLLPARGLEAPNFVVEYQLYADEGMEDIFCLPQLFLRKCRHEELKLFP